MSEKTIYNASIVEDYEKAGEKKSRWHPVGSGFSHSDGEGIDLVITPGISVSGRVTLRERKEREEAPAEE